MAVNRLLVLSWEYPPHLVGGLGRHVYDLTRELARRGLCVEVLTTGRPTDPPEEERDGVRVHGVSLAEAEGRPFPIQVSLTNLNLLRQAVLLARGPGPPFDLIHAHDWLVAFAARLLKHAYRLPLIATIHATEHGRNRGIHNQLHQHIHDCEWQLAYEAWRVICCSGAMRGELTHVLAVPPDKLEVIQNGVAQPSDRSPAEVEAFRARFAAPRDPLVVYAGRLVVEKGPLVLLDALARVRERHPGIQAVLAGAGGLRGALEHRAGELGLAGQVHFAGHLGEADLDLLYRAADVAVFPSTYEPFGIVALEAMARGIPVVVGDTGGLAEIVAHGETGLKVWPGSADSLAWGILEILDNREWAAQLGRQAAAHVRAKYTWERVATATLEVYERVQTEWAATGWKQEEGQKDPLELIGPRVFDRWSVVQQK